MEDDEEILDDHDEDEIMESGEEDGEDIMENMEE